MSEFCDFISLSSMKERSKYETEHAIKLAGAHLHYNAGIHTNTYEGIYDVCGLWYDVYLLPNGIKL